MSQERPLSRLGAYVAAARARGRPTRLVLRNADRFGLVHLYFQQGHLVAVEGYRGSGRASLVAVSSWANGTIRQDDLDNQPLGVEPDPALDRDLDTLVSTIQARGGSTGPLTPPVGASMPSAPSATPPGVMPVAPLGPSRISLPSLPSLDAVPTTPMTPMTPTPPPAGAPPAWSSAAQHPLPLPPRLIGPGESTPTAMPGFPPAAGQDPSHLPLTPPQWQVMAQAMHNIVERAGMVIGREVAAGFLLQALNRLAAHSPFLAGLEVDDAAWLHARPAALAQCPGYEVASSIAELMMAYEERCGALVGQAGARQIITEAIAPLRQALAQVGLDVAEG